MLRRLTLHQEPEIYYGEPTGKTRWLAMAQDTRHPTASVLGRAYTRSDAVADWNLRASLDHHVVEGIDQDNADEFTAADIIIQKAIAQLNQSDRGHSALVALSETCDRFTGLDILNQQAVLSLVSSVFSYPQSGRESIKRGAASGLGFY